MTKDALRKEAKARRDCAYAALSVAERCAAAVLLAVRIVQHLEQARTVAVYLPIGSEVDTLPTVERLEQLGVTVALPHVTGRRGTMRFLRWRLGDILVEGPMGLRQPDAGALVVIPDLILTPLLAFDTTGARLGYGEGHYDRAFVLHDTAHRIGLSWHCQQVATLPVDAWDVPLHAIATETDWIEV